MTDRLRTILTARNSVRGATGLLVVTLTISNILGLLRDRFLAATIPADNLDSYYAAFRLPDLLTNLIVVGAISVAFLPLFTEIRTRDEREGWQAANAILNITILALVLGSILLILFIPNLMPLVVPDFSANKLAQTVTLARWLSLTPILFGISYLLSGILNSFQRFTVYAFTPLVYNASIIGATLFSNRFPIEERVMVVTIGVLVGASLHMLIQLPLAVMLGWRWQGVLTIRHPAVQKLKNLMLPRTIGLLANQLSTIVATAIASNWSGAITYFNLANNIQTMPTAVFASSIATAVFPSLSALATTKADNAFRSHLVQGIRWIFFILIPAAAGLILMRIQIVRLVLGSGFFGWEATKVTADVLGWFAVSLVASGLVPLLARGFYARQDMRTPMSIALVSALLTIGLSYGLPTILPRAISVSPKQVLHVGEVAALAIAFSIGMFVNAGLLLWEAIRQYHLDLRVISQSLPKILLATVVMTILVQAAKWLVGSTIDLSQGSGILLQTFVGVAVGAATYLTVLSILRVPEWHELKNVLAKKISTRTSIALD